MLPLTIRLQQARARAAKARRRAMSGNDVKSWHRYRIAVKNLRYLAMVMHDMRCGNGRLEKLIARCRTLQDLLGE